MKAKSEIEIKTSNKNKQQKQATERIRPSHPTITVRLVLSMKHRKQTGGYCFGLGARDGGGQRSIG